jgi:alpha-tubulin suppressor-like RCC1 family protein
MRLPILRASVLASILMVGGCDGTTAPDIHLCLDGCGTQTFYLPPASPSLPAPVVGGLSFKAISLGRQEVCAVTTTGDAYCWGLDYATASRFESPQRVPGDFKFDTISVGNRFACGIATDKRTLCWGANDAGQIGNGLYGETVPIPTPTLSPVAFKSISAAGWDVGSPDGHSSFACGLGVDGIVYCWGTNTVGQLGTGAATPNVKYVVPYPIAGRTYTALAGGGFATSCALAADRTAFCWGNNEFGEMGIPAGAGAFPPTLVSSDLHFVTLSTWYATCGITTTGDTYCWGSSGIVPGSVQVPTKVTSLPFVSIAAGGAHACGLTADGSVYCWGSNASGQLGDGTTKWTDVPVLVATDVRFVRIAAGDEQTCGLTATGAAYCWGANGGGMLGRGT